MQQSMRRRSLSINYTYEITLVEPMADYELELIAANCEDLVDEDTED